ncbi:hypothetical protein ACQEVC_10725 [Plantactinospora sp. CA-294935]|uniref:hypothetical protein n=1 Tax=Plantactinospora sp. CA-294935 TaxID=3240012 RepID=UPI003D89FA3A
MTTGPEPEPAPPHTGRHHRAVDDNEIRRRSVNTAAADYTLYVRHLIEQYHGVGGQAAVLRIARRKGILPTGFTRQSLSEQLNGRYKHGPMWSTTLMVINSLPDECDTASILATAAGLHAHARRSIPPGYDGPTSWPPDSEPRPEIPESNPTIPKLQDTIARHRRQHRTEIENLLNTLRTVQDRRREADQRADRAEAQYLTTREELLALKATAAETATLREEYARLAAEFELLAAPGLRTHRLLDLPDLPHTRQRVRLGHLAQAIDPTAPPARRAVARYLCAYTEFAGATTAELSVRAGLHPATVQDILTARRAPTDAQADEIAAVLHADRTTARHLAALARGI